MCVCVLTNRIPICSVWAFSPVPCLFLSLLIGFLSLDLEILFIATHRAPSTEPSAEMWAIWLLSKRLREQSAVHAAAAHSVHCLLSMYWPYRTESELHCSLLCIPLSVRAIAINDSLSSEMHFIIRLTARVLRLIGLFGFAVMPLLCYCCCCYCRLLSQDPVLFTALT